MADIEQSVRMARESRDLLANELQLLVEAFLEECGDHCNNWCWHEKAAELVRQRISDLRK